MSNDDIEKIVREYLKKTVHMSLGTSRDNKPWVCEVHFANDEKLNLYFVSKRSTRHCQDIDLNSNVAGNIVKQHSLTESPHGIYFEGEAQMLISPTDDEIETYCQALGRDVAELKARVSAPDDEHHLYKIVVRNWAVFGRFSGETSQKSVLTWNGGQK